jgi:hypothetical protein
MKRLFLGILCVVLTASSLVFAQDQSKPASKSDSSHWWITGARSLTVSGKVSDDGKTFVTDIDSEWAVNNPEALKGYEGRTAALKCFVDSDRNRIHVLSVKIPEMKYAYRQGDSAFRR